MISIVSNGNTITLEQSISVKVFLEEYCKDIKHPVVWINGKSILFSEYNNTYLENNDILTIVRVSYGG